MDRSETSLTTLSETIISKFAIPHTNNELFNRIIQSGREEGSIYLVNLANQYKDYNLIAYFVQYLFTMHISNERPKNEPPNKRVKGERSAMSNREEEEDDDDEIQSRRYQLHSRIRALNQELLRLQDTQDVNQELMAGIIQEIVRLHQQSQMLDEFDTDTENEELDSKATEEKNQPNSSLMRAKEWIPCLICKGQLSQFDLYMQLLKESRGVCGATWRYGQVAFKCRTCEKDPTCAICQQCFLNSNHEGHNYSLIKTSSGMCDCGDPNSWDPKGFCVNHKGPSQDPTEHLPNDIRQLVKAIFTGVIRAVYYLTALDQTQEHDLRYLFEILEEYSKQSPAIKRFLLQAIAPLDKELGQNGTLLAMLMEKQKSFSYAFSHWIHQFYSACIADTEFKTYFAIEFTKNYKTIIDSYFAMPTRRRPVNISHLAAISVQIFTVPPIAEMLCKEHNLLQILTNVLTDVCNKLLVDDTKRNRKKINATDKNLRKSAMYHFFYDLSYVLMHNSINNEFMFNPAYFGKFLQFLFHYQYCVEVIRIDSDDDSWEMAVGFEFQMLPKLFRYISNGIDSLKSSNIDTSFENIKKVVAQNIHYLKKFFAVDQMPLGPSINPRVPQIFQLKTTNGPISFHIPLHKILGSVLVPIVRNWNFNLLDLFHVNIDDRFVQQLMDYPLRICATISHVRNRLWPRNNMHIGDQARCYVDKSWAEYTVCQDIFLLQLCYCMMSPEVFFTLSLDRYAGKELFLLKIPQRLEPDAQQINVMELDYMHFLLTLWSDRNLSGLSRKEACRKFILHALFKSQETFSSIQDSVPKYFRLDINLDEIIKEVADYHSPQQSHEQGYFTVKKQFWNEYDPYFIHYSPKQRNEIEENYRKLFHKELIVSLPVPQRPFQSMEKLMYLIHSAAFHRLLFTILYRTVTNETTSENLTISALHAIILSLETIPYELLDSKNEDLPGQPQQIKSLYDMVFPSDTNLLRNVLQEFIVEGDNEKRSMLSLIFNIADKKGSKEVERLIGRILQSLCTYDDRCKVLIDQHNATVGKDTFEKEREKKKKKALARQKKIMMAFNKKHSSIDERLFGGLTSPEAEEESRDDKKCAFCHENVSPGGFRSFSMICHIVPSNTLNVVEAQNLIDELLEAKASEEIQSSLDCKVEWWKTNNIFIGKYNELFNDIKTHPSVQMNCCSHICHFDCFDSYLQSLMSNTRHYKGENVIHPHLKEILCPVCGRLANELCPIVNEVSLNTHKVMGILASKPANIEASLSMNIMKLRDTLKEAIISKELSTIEGYDMKDIESSRFSLQNALKDFFSHVVSLKLGIRKETVVSELKYMNPSVLSSTIAYNIATHEVAQRTIDESDPKLLSSLRQSEQEQLLTLMESARACHLLEPRLRDLSQESLHALYNCIFVDGSIPLVDHESETLSTASSYLLFFQSSPQLDEMIPPLLSCDLFTLFVQLLLLKPSLVQWSTYNETMQLFYAAHIVQSVLIFVYRYKSLDMLINDLNKNQDSGMKDDELQSCIEHVARTFIVPNYALLVKIFDPKTSMEESKMEQDDYHILKSLCLTFVRRVSLLTSVLFKSGIPVEDADYDLGLLNEREKYAYEFDKLRRYLALPDLKTMLKNLSNGSVWTTMVNKWLNQLSHSLENTVNNPKNNEDKRNKIVSKLLAQHASKPRQFHFVKLPSLYQTLFLKYYDSKCPNCSRKLQLPALCLITGRLIWCKNCECAPPNAEGKCTQWAKENFCGVGFDLLITTSNILLLRETRRSVLPSFYLDQHGEEDKQLIRGVPLYLNQARLNSYIKHFVRNSWDQDTILLEKTDGVYTNRF